MQSGGFLKIAKASTNGGRDPILVWFRALC